MLCVIFIHIIHRDFFLEWLKVCPFLVYVICFPKCLIGIVCDLYDFYPHKGVNAKNVKLCFERMNIKERKKYVSIFAYNLQRKSGNFIISDVHTDYFRSVIEGYLVYSC